MSTYPGQPVPQQKKTLTWLAIACFVVGLGLTGVFVYRIVATAPSSPQSIDGGTVKLEKEGLTLYSSVPVLRAPCQVEDANGADVPLKSPSGSETITVNGESWYVVARSVSAVPPGDYEVTCSDTETSATYAVGPRMSVAAFVVAILGTVFSFLIFVGLGIVFLVVNGVKNRRRNRPGNTFPSGGPGQDGPGYGGPGQGAPGNYPPPGNTFPTQPPGNFPPYNPGPNPDRPQDR
jgi:hypothetical protein